MGGRGARSSIKNKDNSKDSKSSSFNDFRFSELNYKRISNNYITMDRVSKDEEKIVVRVSSEHLKETLYGYALILDEKNVVFLKSWQVSQNYYGNEVMLTKKYWNVKQWGDHSAFIGTNEKDHNYNTWVETAKAQSKQPVKWLDGEKSKKEYIRKLMYGR